MIDKYDIDTLGNDKYVKGVTCSGKTLPLSQQCHDGDDTTPVCNYVHSNPNRNAIAIGFTGKRSYLDVCKDNL